MDKIETFPLSELTFSQKLNLMETIWDDLTRNEKDFKSPTWHAEILKDREEALQAGKVKVSDWEEAKLRIKKDVK
jgi:putative addiction module component (TIGR02574 family)